MNSDKIKQISDATFEAEVLKSSLPVLVDYSADWCGPCKMIAPLLDDAAGTYYGKLSVAKIDVDASPDLAAKHGVRGIPTLMMFVNGEVVATKVGSLSKSQLSAFIDAHVS